MSFFPDFQRFDFRSHIQFSVFLGNFIEWNGIDTYIFNNSFCLSIKVWSCYIYPDTELRPN